MTWFEFTNLVTSSKLTMSEEIPNHANIRHYYGRELARVGDITNSKVEREHYWDFENIIQFTSCASIGLTTSLAMLCFCRFLHRRFLSNE